MLTTLTLIAGLLLATAVLVGQGLKIGRLEGELEERGRLLRELQDLNQVHISDIEQRDLDIDDLTAGMTTLSEVNRNLAKPLADHIAGEITEADMHRLLEQLATGGYSPPKRAARYESKHPYIQDDNTRAAELKFTVVKSRYRGLKHRVGEFLDLLDLHPPGATPTNEQLAEYHARSDQLRRDGCRAEYEQPEGLDAFDLDREREGA